MDELESIPKFLDLLRVEKHISLLIFMNNNFVFGDKDGGVLHVRNRANLSNEEGELLLREFRHIEGR